MPTERLSLFRLLDRRLASEGTVSVGELLDEAGEQTWGLAVLLLALLTFIPGVANLLSLGTLVLGLQLWWGRRHPWLPAALQRHELQHGHIKAMLAQVESRLAWLGARTAPRRAPGRRTLGFLVTWTAFLAALPVPLPLANVLPAVALILFGLALLEEWPLLAWLGAGLSLLTTAYFALSGGVLWRALRAAVHAVMR